MGLFGITEGAIPFAAADPLRVIPSNMVGGAVGAILAGLLGVKDVVMHGGPIVGFLGAATPLWWELFAIVVGAIVTAVMAVGLKSIGVSGRKTAEDSQPVSVAAD
jgi:PTS system fructose-specific IIC component